MKKSFKNIDDIINGRVNVLLFLVIFLFLFLAICLFKVQILDNKYYLDKLTNMTRKVVDGFTAPRGRIYDRNGVLIVDNVPIKTITYKRVNNVSVKDEVKLAYKLSSILSFDISSVTRSDMVSFWLACNDSNFKITDEEWDLLAARKISRIDIDLFKRQRVTDSDLEKFDDKDKLASHVYSLMNDGYYYDTKIIKKGDSISDLEYAFVSENLDELPGINVGLDWDRSYLYGNVFKSILGNVSNVPREYKDKYLSLGYNINDRVGVSYLEYQYDNYLRGSKDKYEVFLDGTMNKISSGVRGNDIYLTIDIRLQKEVERILEEQLVITKSEPNTEFYNRSFVVITDPNTGEVLAMAGKQIIMSDVGYKIIDYTPGLFTSPVAVGSVVKGASHIVGYNTGALKIGEYRDDSCIKIMSTKEKCSWTYLGYLNDIDALKYSSNTYQFRTAINVGGGNYYYDGPLSVNSSAFKTYRDIFNQFGLGVKTGIDLPNESVGLIGKKETPGLLLDFSIGQYDTYTALQLAQYIGSVATGHRMKLELLKKVVDGDSLVFNYSPVILNNIETDQVYLDRVRNGFHEVILGGTGYGYIDYIYDASGKTGTSQSFIDSDLDGVIDKETLTNTFVAYAPSVNPIVTFTVISPDYTHYYNGNYYQSSVNKRITYEVSKKFFEIYK